MGNSQILSSIQESKVEIKNEIHDVKTEIRDVKNEIHDVKTEIHDVKNEIHDVKNIQNSMNETLNEILKELKKMNGNNQIEKKEIINIKKSNVNNGNIERISFQIRAESNKIKEPLDKKLNKNHNENKEKFPMDSEKSDSKISDNKGSDSSKDKNLIKYNKIKYGKEFLKASNYQ